MNVSTTTLRPLAKTNFYSLDQVRLLPGPFRDAQERNKEYILRWEVDRLMHWFRVNRGLPSHAVPYDRFEIREYNQLGHFQGHYLSGCALMYRNTGDIRFKERGDEMVAIFASVQAPNGWIGPFPEIHMEREVGLSDDETVPLAAVPWYAVHKILAGLLDMHVHGGNAEAMEVLLRAVHWVKTIADRVPEDVFQARLDREHGGMNEVLADLYAVTGDPAHLDLAKRFCHRAVLSPLAEGRDVLDGLHANTQIPKFTGCAHIHRHGGGDWHGAAARNFWQTVVSHRTYVTGGNSEFEHFAPTARFSQYLGAWNTETCNTYNMLKLTRALHGLDPIGAAMDYYERALTNHILGSQHPVTALVNYFTPLHNGSPKQDWHGVHRIMSCCHASCMESHSKYADTIYSRDGERDLRVNLFLSSELAAGDGDWNLRQETSFPEEGACRIVVKSAPRDGRLILRRPGWVHGAPVIQRNGKPLSLPTAETDGYLRLSGRFAAGDRIDVEWPMAFRWEGFADRPQRMALCRGPMVMVAKTEEGNRHGMIWGDVEGALQTITPASDDPGCFLAPAETFSRKFPAVKGATRILPMYRETHDPYVIYWDHGTDTDRRRMARELDEETARWNRLAGATTDLVFRTAGTHLAPHCLQGYLNGATPVSGGDGSEADHRFTPARDRKGHLDLPVGGRHATAWISSSAPLVCRLKTKMGSKSQLLIRLYCAPKESRYHESTGDGAGASVKIGEIEIGRYEGIPENGHVWRDVVIPIPDGLMGGDGYIQVSIQPMSGKTTGAVAEIRSLGIM